MTHLPGMLYTWWPCY